MKTNFLFIIILILQLVACSTNNHHKNDMIVNNIENTSFNHRYTKENTEITKPTFKQIGIASWYGGKDGLHNKKTASGERFNKNDLTAAHPTLAMNTKVKVTNLENNKNVVLTINDRGPFLKNRIIDVSEKAAKLLDMKIKGVAKVMVEHIEN